jgi:hypothetical protein
MAFQLWSLMLPGSSIAAFKSCADATPIDVVMSIAIVTTINEPRNEVDNLAFMNWYSPCLLVDRSRYWRPV